MRLCDVGFAEAYPAIVGQVCGCRCASGRRFRMEGLLPRAADLRFDLGKADSAEGRGCAAQAAEDYVVVETYGVEEMGPTVAIHHRDAHLRHDLREALIEGLEHVLLAQFRGGSGRGLQSEPRTYRACPRAQQHGSMVEIAAVSCFDCESDACADAGIDERVMDSTSGESHRHRELFLTGRHISEQQQLCTARDQRDCLRAETID